MSAKITAITNQKGGVGKTNATVNLGVGLARCDKNVLLVDCDPQASLTISLGQHQPDQLSITIATFMTKIISEQPVTPREGILRHDEGVDFVPSNIDLSGMDMSLINVMSRETILRQYLDSVKNHYDYILLDCLAIGLRRVRTSQPFLPLASPYQPRWIHSGGNGWFSGRRCHQARSTRP